MHSIIKTASYTLYHVPDMVLHNGTTQIIERIVNPDSDYLKALPQTLRTYAQARDYLPNQTYIGNLTPDELAAAPQPWYDLAIPGNRYGKFGEIMPEEEFYLLMQACDVFDILFLERGFVQEVLPRLSEDPILTANILARIHEGKDLAMLMKLVNEEFAQGLYVQGRLVGVVRRGHDIDENLSAHVLLENLAVKASSLISLLYALKNSGMDALEIDYVIECSEAACGDMNQRGGGNFAKAVAEIAGLSNATGADIRDFCAGPTHALITAASLVKAGTYRNVAVIAGGCTAKLGMNGKEHVKKGLPILEDVLGAFCILISQNDGVNPEVNLDILGRHTVGTGSSPQAVINSLVAQPLEEAGLGILDIEKYSPELQNPEITKPAGAGDVPLANYKMIGALAVKRCELEKALLSSFPTEHGMIGWAPTQGHIPSAIPYIGFAIENIRSNKIARVMLIGKGSLFLGRMTNLFDGVSVILQANSSKQEEQSVSKEQIRLLIAQSMREFANSLMVLED